MAYAIAKLGQEYTIGAVDRAQAVQTEVRSAAQWVKRNGGTGVKGDALPELISNRAYTWIANNPYAFRLMVRDA